MFCFHKYSEVKEGYQYCLKCGKAIVAPCPHKWAKIDEITIRQHGLILGYYIVDRCKNCGEVKKTYVGWD